MTPIERIQKIIQTIQSLNILSLPDDITFEIDVEMNKVDDEGLQSVAYACIEDYVVYLAPSTIHLSPKKLTETVCHELIHLEQAYTGKLSLTDDNRFCWYGKRYEPARNYKEYRAFPWEREAYRRDKQVGKLVYKAMENAE